MRVRVAWAVVLEMMGRFIEDEPLKRHAGETCGFNSPPSRTQPIKMSAKADCWREAPPACRFNGSSLFCAIFLAASTCHAQNFSPLQALPTQINKNPYNWFASTDAQKQNNDFLLLQPGETRRVPLSVGYLERLWSTSDQPETLRLQLQSGGKTVTLLEKNRAAQGKWSGKAYTLYNTFAAPLLLKADATLIATNGSAEKAKWFYQASVRPFVAINNAVQVLAPPKIISVERLLKDGDSLGAFDVSGGFKYGQVEKLEITLKPATLQTWNLVFLRAFATGEQSRGPGSLSEMQNAPTTPDPKFAINAPLLALSGQFFAANPRSDAVSDFDGTTLTLKWPLPFDKEREAPVVDLFNTSAGRVTVKIKATVRQLSASPPLIFHAEYGSALPQSKKPIPIAEFKGQGALVGLTMATKPTITSKRRAFAYLEGNELIRADGKLYEGTGTEDFFNSAWYFPEKPFSGAYGGMTFKNPLPPQVSMYRWLVPDALPFSQGLKFDFEHGNGNNATDVEFRWLVCWYQKPGGSWEVADNLGDEPDDKNEKRARDAHRETVFKRYILGSTAFFLALSALVGIWSLLKKRRAN